MLIRLLIPFFYSILLGGVWSAAFGKKFSSSLAPAYMAHIIIVLLSGMIFRRLTPGIYGGIAIALVSCVWLFVRNRHAVSKRSAIKYFRNMLKNGLFLFTVFYLFCFVLNFGKCFMAWDEFSHWGIFLKETLRLDRLYCMSPVNMAHKDYVPAITLFETIWCRIGGKFTEANAYRAIQMFLFSMLLPAFERVSDYAASMTAGRSCNLAVTATSSGKGLLPRARAIFLQLVFLLFALMLPLFFHTENGFRFYHSIYCDIAVGVIFYWCIYEIYQNYENLSYHLFTLTVGIIVLVLSKMTSMALLPLILAFIIGKYLFFANQERGNPIQGSVNEGDLGKRVKSQKKRWLYLVPVFAFPVTFWYLFNRFVDSYVDNTGYLQSYDGMSISSLKEVFTSPSDSTIPYLGQLQKEYFSALFHRDILIRGSYVVVLVLIVAGFLCLSVFVSGKLAKRRLVFSGIWTAASGVFYAVLMYFLYATAFNEHEAVGLASYRRYMNSFIISVLFLLVAAYYDSGLWKKHIRVFCLLPAILLLDLIVFHRDAFNQVLPGTITGDAERNRKYTLAASKIMNAAEEDARIYVIRRGDNTRFLWHERYYCLPRTIDGGSIGPAVDEADLWSVDLSAQDLSETLKGYDYIFFSKIDDAFAEKYADVFEDYSQVSKGKLYQIEEADGKVRLTDCT